MERPRYILQTAPTEDTLTTDEDLVNRLEGIQGATLDNIATELENLNATLDNIPERTYCYGCGEATVIKDYIDYEYDWLSLNTRITIAKSLPGYVCKECDITYRDSALSTKFLEHIAEAFKSNNHSA